MADHLAEAMEYCPDLSRRTERLRRLYSRRGLDEVFAIMNIPRQALVRFAELHPAGPCGYPDPEERAQFWDSYWKESAGVFDDRVPAAPLSELDQGLYGGLVGGEVRFVSATEGGWISSMVPPLLSDWKELDSLRLDEHGLWAQRYRHILDVFVSASRGRFGISHFILIDSLNFVFELLGATRTYMSLDEEPERVHQAIDFAFDLNAWVQDRFFQSVPLVQGGTCSGMGSWVPGRVVTESMDPFHMTSAEYLAKWGIEPIERILSRYDGGLVHIHGNGRHLLETACRIRGLRGIYLGDDHGFPAAFDVLPELRRRAGDMPLIVSVPFPAFCEKLKTGGLVGGVLYTVTGVPDAGTANRTMEQVRKYVPAR